jgi:gliding motility-associated-like protein
MPQNYTLKLILKTDSGCVDSISKKNYITIYPKPIANFNWDAAGDGTTLNPEISFTNTSTYYSSFQWDFGDLTDNDFVTTHPIHYYNTNNSTNYNAFLAVTNQYNCTDTVSKLIEINPYFTFYIPNTFTPNNDNTNDFFTGKGIGIKTFKMWIFDRWGENIYYTEDITIGWNGDIKKNVVDSKMDVYQWKVILTDMKDKQHIYIGNVNLIK